MRAANAVANNRAPHGGQHSDIWYAHLLGAFGEVAAAKGLRLYWPGHYRVYRGVDDIAGLEIRTSARHAADLSVYEDAPLYKLHVLVTGWPTPPEPELWLHGWFDPRAGFRDEWLKRGGGGWFVPQACLNPFPLPPVMP